MGSTEISTSKGKPDLFLLALIYIYSLKSSLTVWDPYQPKQYLIRE